LNTFRVVDIVGAERLCNIFKWSRNVKMVGNQWSRWTTQPTSLLTWDESNAAVTSGSCHETETWQQTFIPVGWRVWMCVKVLGNERKAQSKSEASTAYTKLDKRMKGVHW